MSAPQLVIRIDRMAATVWAGTSAMMLPALKAVGAIDWDWIWVLSPLWASAALAAILTLVLLPAGWSK
jgi:hypothetical protein